MIKFVQYGCGKMSKYTVPYAKEKNMKLVGAIDNNPDVIGKDFYGVKIVGTDNAKELLKKTKPDICIVETMSLLSDVKEALLLCAELGINAITTCEEAFFSYNSNPTLTKKIDLLAKKNNCTITGTGYQDAFWGNLISTLCGSTDKIIKIKGKSSYNVEDYGIALAEAHGAGMSVKDFNSKIASADNISDRKRNNLIKNGEFLPSYMWNVNGWLCDKLGLTVTCQTQKCVPQFCDKDIFSSTLNMDIKKGICTGMSAVVTTKTKEGITIETECIGKVYSSDDYDCNIWSIEGVPNTELIINKPDTVSLTCATIVNRIPDVINSKPGFVPTSRMGELKYIK